MSQRTVVFLEDMSASPGFPIGAVELPEEYLDGLHDLMANRLSITVQAVLKEGRIVAPSLSPVPVTQAKGS